MSIREFAKTVGVSETRVRERIKRHARIEEAVFPDGSLDPDEATALWFVDLDVSKMRNPPTGESGEGRAAINFNQLKADRMAVDLEAAQINLEQLKKSTIDREVARRVLAAYARRNRDTILNFANRYGAELAAVVGCEPRALITALDAKLRDALNEMADQPSPFAE